ncbi:cyclase family protein [Bacteriovoracaceae bacterium]|nr:cyclase family protein [Bacteriovoracaceae bacterium]
MKTIFLSHPFRETFPSYGQPDTSIEVEAVKSISCGDSCHTYTFKMNNHWGTHIDSPNHFYSDGKKLTDYDASFWEFDKAQIIDVDVSKRLVLEKDDFVGKVAKDTDILFVRSGYTEKRCEACYATENPGIHSEVGFYLRKNFPGLRVIAMDFISISSRTNREEGRKSHQAFLNPNGHGDPILIAEDVKISKNIQKISKVTILPLMIEQIDSAPCTIIGKVAFND